MYNIESIITLKEKEWKKLDPSGVTFGTLSTFEKVFINVTHGDLVGSHQINFNEISSDSGTDSNTVLETYLQSFTAATITTIDFEDIKHIGRPKKAKYKSMFDMGIRVESALYDTSGNPSGLEPDIKLSVRPNSIGTAEDLLESSVVLINGNVVNNIEYKDGDVYLIDQMDFLNHPDLPNSERSISLIDFSELGVLQRVPFADASGINVLAGPSTDVQRFVEIDIVPDMTGKYPILVLGGSIMIDRGLWSVSGQKLSLTLDVDRLISKEFRSADKLSWIDAANSNSNGYLLSSFDPIKYLQENCELLLLDEENLGIHKEYLHRTTIEGRYTHYRIPQGILLLDDNTVGEYHIDSYEDNIVSISSSLPITMNRLVDTVPNGELISVTNAESLVHKSISKALMVDIYRL